ncbi:MAG: DUF2244 domain-containing protein, partial [Pseudomonadota bacterium]
AAHQTAHRGASGAGAHMTELRPHRSLSGPAFKVLMAVFCVVSVAVGGFFLWLGAWPVTGYFGLDLLAIYLAFRWNYRAGRVCERVEVNADKLVLTRVAPSGTESAWEFNPYWARIERHQQTPNCSVLELTSHGERVAFGKFLTEEEKASVADRLQNVLRTFRETGRVPAT